MQYLTVEQARQIDGLRLVVTAGVPGPWSESAKKIFEYKKIEYRPVAQYLNEENSELRSWVGVRNAPVAVLGDEAPALTWRDILFLAERMRPLPGLLPHLAEQRDAVLDLSNEICGEWGFGWCRRLMLIELARSMAPVDEDAARIQLGYGFDPDAAARAPARLAVILRALSARLHQQSDRGSDFFVGPDLSACDIYWACFSLMVRPLPPHQAAMPDVVRQFYDSRHPLVDAALDEVLIEHRDRVLSQYLKLPLDF